MKQYLFAITLLLLLHWGRATATFTITNTYVKSGTTSTITCAIQGLGGNPTAGGFKSISLPDSADAGTYGPGNDEFTTKLTLSNPTTDGTYTCYATRGTEQTQTFTVDVVTVPSLNVVVESGQTASITCKSSSQATQVSSVEIMHGSTSTISGSNIAYATKTASDTVATATIASVTADLTYTCRFIWGSSQLETTHNVDVVSMSFPNTYIKSGSDSSAVTCEVDSLSTEPSKLSFTSGGTTWELGHTDTSATVSAKTWSNNKYSATLTLHSAYLTGDKTVTCTLQYHADSATMTKENIYDVVSVSSTEVGAGTGDTVSLTCTVSNSQSVAASATISYTGQSYTTTGNTATFSTNTIGSTIVTAASAVITADTTYTCSYTFGTVSFVDPSTYTIEFVQFDTAAVAAIASTDVTLTCKASGNKVAVNTVKIKYGSNTKTSPSEVSIVTNSGTAIEATHTVVGGFSSDTTYTCEYIWTSKYTLTDSGNKVDIVAFAFDKTYTKASSDSHDNRCTVSGLSQEPTKLTFTVYMAPMDTGTSDSTAVVSDKTWSSSQGEYYADVKLKSAYIGTSDHTVTCTLHYSTFSSLTHTAVFDYVDITTAKVAAIASTSTTITCKADGHATQVDDVEVSYTPAGGSAVTKTKSTTPAVSLSTNSATATIAVYTITSGLSTDTAYTCTFKWGTITLADTSNKVDIVTLSFPSAFVKTGDNSGTVSCEMVSSDDSPTAMQYKTTDKTWTVTTPNEATVTAASWNGVSFTYSGSIQLDAAYLTTDKTVTCEITYNALSTISIDAYFDVVSPTTLEVAAVSGQSTSLVCELANAQSVATSAKAVLNAVDHALSLGTNNVGDIKGSATASGISADATYTCSYTFATGSFDATTEQKVEFLTMEVEDSYTESGDDSAAITCKMHQISTTTAPSAVSFSDGSKTWNAATTATNEATVSAVSNPSSGVHQVTLTLKKEYFVSDKTITCSMTYGRTALTKTATADIFTLTSNGYKADTCTDCTVTCTISGVQLQPTGVAWTNKNAADTVAGSWQGGSSTWESILTVKTVNKDTAFTCQFTLDSIIREDTATVDVIDIAITGETYKSLSGAQTVTFTCTAKVDHSIHAIGIGPNPKGDYNIDLGSWNSVTKEVIATLKMTNQDTDTTFSCWCNPSTSNHNIIITTDSSTLDVIDITAETYPFVSGTAASLSCLATGYSPTATHPTSAIVNSAGSILTSNSDVSSQSSQTLVSKAFSLSGDTTYTCKFDWTSPIASVKKTVTADLVDVKDVKVALISGNTVTVYCDVQGTLTKANSIEIVVSGTTYSTVDGKATMVTNTDSQSKASKVLSGITFDTTYSCNFHWTSNTITVNAGKIDVIEMTMNTVYVRKGDDSDPITCKFYQVNAVFGEPDGLEFSDGTHTWTFGHSDSNAVVSAKSWANQEYSATLTLKAAHLTSDKKITCTVTYGYSTVSVQSDADVFEITKLDWSLLSGSKAIMSCKISGIQIKPTDVAWGVIIPTHEVKHDTWDSTNGVWGSTLTMDVVTADTTYTCTFDVNGKQHKINPMADVVVTEEKRYSTTNGKQAQPQCCITQAVKQPVSFSFIDGATTYTSSNGVTKGSFANNAMCATLTVTAGSADKTYTCRMTMDNSANTLDQNVKVDVYTWDIPYVKHMQANGNNLVIDVKSSGWDKQPTITWVIGGTTYTVASSKVSEVVDGTGRKNTLTHSLTSPNNIAITMKVTFDHNEEETTLTHDVFEIAKSDNDVVQRGNSSTITCQITGVDSGTVLTAFTWSAATSPITTASKAITGGTEKSLTNPTVTADEVHTCEWNYGSMGKFSLAPKIDMIITDPIGDFVEVGAAGTVTCKVENSDSNGDILFTLLGATIHEKPIQEGDWCKYNDMTTSTITDTGKTTNLATAKTGCTAQNSCHGLVKIGIEYKRIGSDTFTWKYNVGSVIYRKQTCPSVSQITTNAYSNNAFSRVLVGTFSNDTNVDCVIMIGTKTFDAKSSVDTFVLSGVGYATKKGEHASVSAKIEHSFLKLKSENVLWSADDDQKTKTVSWSQWDNAKGSISTTLKLEKVDEDTKYTAVFTVNGKKWNKEVQVDVIEYLAMNTTVKKGDSTVLSCGYKDALTTHTQVYWNGTAMGTGKKISSTQQVTNYTFATTTCGAYTCTTLEVAKADSDELYTCYYDFPHNTLAWVFKSDTFTVTTQVDQVRKGTTAKVTCSVHGSDMAPTGWKWKVGSAEHSANTAGIVIKPGTYTNGNQDNILEAASQTVDSTVTCQFTVDSKSYTSPVAIDVIDIKTVGTTVLVGSKATLTCTVTGSKVAPTDISWKEGSNVYKAGTSTPGFNVTKTSFSGEEQQATLEIDTTTQDKTYDCVVDYANVKFTEPAQLDVHKLKVTGEAEVLTGKAATFTCTMSESKTKPTNMSWTYDGALVGAAAFDNTTFNITEESYLNEVMKSILVIKNVTADKPLICTTSIIFTFSTSPLHVDAYEMVPQLTLAVHNEDAIVDMRFEKLNKEIADSRIDWYYNNTKLTDTSKYTKKHTYNAGKKEQISTLTIKKSEMTTKSAFECRVDSNAAYSATSHLDVATITFTPTTINIINGTSYTFTAKMTGFTANYTKSITWRLNYHTILKPKTVTWDSTKKELHTTVDAVGAVHGQNNLTINFMSNHSQVYNKAIIEVSAIKIPRHVHIKPKATLDLVCEVDNVHSDIKAGVAWLNRGKTLTTVGDNTITTNYDSTKKEFTSTLQIRNYEHTDQVYSCSVTMAKSTVIKESNVWQFVFFETNQAVAFDATTILTCKVSGSPVKPTWKWFPHITSIEFEQSENAWNASEGSQESYFKIFKIKKDIKADCIATMGPETYNRTVIANPFSISVNNHTKGTIYEDKNSQKPIMFNLHLRNLKLLVNISATFHETTYDSWSKNPSGYKWDIHGDRYTLEISNAQKKNGKIEFSSIRLSPPPYKPAKILPHILTASLDVKFFHGTVTKDAVLSVGESTNFTCCLYGGDLTGVVKWAPDNKTKLTEKLKITTTYNKTSDETKSILTTPKSLNRSAAFTCQAYDFQATSYLWFFSVTGHNATTIAGKKAILGCVAVGAKKAATEIYWERSVNGNIMKYTPSSSPEGATIKNHTFDSSKGIQVSTMTINDPTTDVSYTCKMKIDGILAKAVAYLDVIKITADNKSVLKNMHVNVTAKVTGITNDIRPFIYFKHGTFTHDVSHHEVMSSKLSNGEQTFTYPVFHQQMDDSWEFGIKVPANPLIDGTAATFTKTIKIDVIGVSVTHGEGTAGKRRTLECKVEGAIESPGFLWTVNKVALNNTDDTEGSFNATSGSKTSSLQLMVGGGNVNSDVECECIVEAFSDKFTLATYFDVFTMQMTEAKILLGSKLAITAKVENAKQNTVGKIRWYEGATEQPGNKFVTTYNSALSTSVLHPAPSQGATGANDHTYTCMIGDTKVTAKIDLFSVSCTNGTALSGNTATITCNFTNFDGAPDVSWDLPAGTYDTESTQNTIRILKIKSLTKDMTVTLTITSPDGNNQKHLVHAFVRGLVAKNTQSLANKKVTLACHMRGLTSKPTEVYFMDGSTKSLNVQSKYFNSDTELEITWTTSTVLTVDKNYTCAMKFTGEQNAITTTVHVDIIKLTATAISPIPKGQSTHLTCSYTEAKSHYKIKWQGIHGNQSDTNLATKTTGEEGNSVLTVAPIVNDATVTCSIGQASATIDIDMYDIKITESMKHNIGDTIKVECEVVGLKVETDTTWTWTIDGKAVTTGIVNTKSKSTLTKDKLSKSHNIVCFATKGQVKTSASTSVKTKHIIATAMPDSDHHGFLFVCKLVSFDKQPVPAYWSLNGTKYYPETVAPDVVVESGTYDRVNGNGEFSLHYKKVKITGDIRYTCNVHVKEPKEEVLSVVATIDHIETKNPQFNMSVNTKSDITMTALFEKVNADYSDDIVWTNRAQNWTKAKPHNYTVTTTYDSSKHTLKTTFTITKYNMGDGVFVCHINRTNVSPEGSRVVIHVDQYDIVFPNVYLQSKTDTVAKCNCTVANSNSKPSSISITGPSGFSVEYSLSSTKPYFEAGKFSSVSADGIITCAVKYNNSAIYTTKKNIEVVEAKISSQKWSGGNVLFTAVIDEASFNVAEDVSWLVNGKAGAKGVTVTNKYTTDDNLESIITIAGAHNDGYVSIVAGHGSYSSHIRVNKTLDYYFVGMKKVIAEKNRNATVVCKLESYNGTSTPTLTIVANDSSTKESATAQGGSVTLNINAVPGDMTTVCTATIDTNTITHTDKITTYQFDQKVDGVTPSNMTWKDLGSKVTLSCSISNTVEKVNGTPTWMSGKKQLAATTISSDKHTTTLVYSISNDTNISCIFNINKQMVQKHFNLVAKGCLPPRPHNASFKPINEMGKIAPGVTITFKCDNSTKFNLTGEKYVKCTNDKDGYHPFHKFNSTIPHCVFLGDCKDARKVFSNGKIEPKYPFRNNKTYKFKCDSGYRLDGKSEVKCYKDHWHGKLPACSKISSVCSTASWGKAYGNISSPYVTGDKVRVFCSTGYTNSGPGTVTCGSSGWDGTVACTKKPHNQCSNLHVTKGTLTCTKGGVTVTKSFTAGVSCSLSCDKDYILNGNPYAITCQSSGVWNTTVMPSCSRLDAPTTRKLGVHMNFTGTYCQTTSEVSKMQIAVVNSLTNTVKIAVLVSMEANITDFTCVMKPTLYISFNLNQKSSLNNSTMLSDTVTEIKSKKSSMTFSVSATKKRHTIQQRSATYNFSPTHVVGDTTASITCPANKYQYGSTYCVACAAGNYLKSGKCDPCPMKTYNPSEGMTQCTSCPSDKPDTTGVGSIALTQCTTTCTVPHVDNVNTTSIPENTLIEKGAVVYYTCLKDYSLEGSGVFTCGTTDMPKCIKEESKMLLYVGILLGVILFLILLLIVGFCCRIRIGSKDNESTADSRVIENTYANNQTTSKV